jgi:putative DNA primase/helicase
MSPLSDEMRADALAINRREASERQHGRLTIASSAGAPLTRTPTWPELTPLPSGDIPVDPFDYEFLPMALQEWVRDISNRLQCPPDYVAVAAVAALGTLIGRRLGIRPQEKTDWLEIPNLWGMIIGRPGLMKSPAMEQALKPLHRLEIDTREKNEKARQEYAIEFQTFKLSKEAKAALARKTLTDNSAAKVDLECGDEPKEPTAIRYVTNDSSYEALGELLIGNPTGILVERDEVISLLKFLDAEENAGARSFYLTGWSGQSGYTFDRIGRGHRAIEAVCIGIVGNTQPARISEFIRRTNADGMGGDGLMQRFGLLVWPDSPPTWRNVDEYPDAAAREAAWKVFERASKIDLNEALRIGATQVKYDSLPYLRFDLNGLKEFNEWRARHEAAKRSGDLSPALEGHIAKYNKLVPALALINHVADEYEVGAVSLQSVLRALAFTKYLESHARRVYGAGILAEVAAAKAILRRIKGGDLIDGFSVREIRRKDWSHLTESHHIAAGLDLLADHNYVAVQDRPTGQKGGRPSAAYLINPAVKPKDEAGAA